MLNKRNRIKDREAIADLFHKGQSYQDKLLVFKYKKQNQPRSTFAVSVSKKWSKRATKRNRLRRLIYEAIRLELKNIDDPALMVFVIARSSIALDQVHLVDFRKSVSQFMSHAKNV